MKATEKVFMQRVISKNLFILVQFSSNNIVCISATSSSNNSSKVLKKLHRWSGHHFMNFFSQQILLFIKDGFLNYLTMPLTTLFHRRVNINVVGKLVEKRNLLWGSNIWQPFGENWRVSALPGDKEMKISERRNRRIVHIFVLHQIVT